MVMDRIEAPLCFVGCHKSQMLMILMILGTLLLSTTASSHLVLVPSNEHQESNNNQANSQSMDESNAHQQLESHEQQHLHQELTSPSTTNHQQPPAQNQLHQQSSSHHPAISLSSSPSSSQAPTSGGQQHSSFKTHDTSLNPTNIDGLNPHHHLVTVTDNHQNSNDGSYLSPPLQNNINNQEQMNSAQSQQQSSSSSSQFHQQQVPLGSQPLRPILERQQQQQQAAPQAPIKVSTSQQSQQNQRQVSPQQQQQQQPTLSQQQQQIQRPQTQQVQQAQQHQIQPNYQQQSHQPQQSQNQNQQQQQQQTQRIEQSPSNGPNQPVQSVYPQQQQPAQIGQNNDANQWAVLHSNEGSLMTYNKPQQQAQVQTPAQNFALNPQGSASSQAQQQQIHVSTTSMQVQPQSQQGHQQQTPQTQPQTQTQPQMLPPPPPPPPPPTMTPATFKYQYPPLYFGHNPFIEKLRPHSYADDNIVTLNLSHSHIYEIDSEAFVGQRFEHIDLSNNKLGLIHSRSFRIGPNHSKHNTFDPRAIANNSTSGQKPRRPPPVNPKSVTIDFSHNPAIVALSGAFDHIDVPNCLLNFTNSTVELKFGAFKKYFKEHPGHIVDIESVDCCDQEWLLGYKHNFVAKTRCTHDPNLYLLKNSQQTIIDSCIAYVTSARHSMTMPGSGIIHSLAANTPRSHSNSHQDNQQYLTYLILGGTAMILTSLSIYIIFYMFSLKAAFVYQTQLSQNQKN